MTIIYWLSFFIVIPVEYFILSNIGLVIVIVFGMIADNDMSIAKHCIHLSAILRLFIGIVAAISTSAVCGFDARASLIISIPIIVFSDTLIESKPLQNRGRGRVFGTFLTIISHSIFIIFLNLGRVPQAADIIIDMGYLGGLSSVPQDFSVQQIASQAWLG
jgi:hypothetical protein